MSEPECGQNLLTRADEADYRRGSGVGRHAADEDAALTPIFHALASGGWATRQDSPADTTAAATTTATSATTTTTGSPEPDPIETDPIETFRRDPLVAPLPPPGADEMTGRRAAWRGAEGRHAVGTPPVTGRRRAGAHAAPEVRQGGRHYRRLIPLDGGASEG